MQVENFYVPIGKVIPELDRKFACDMHIHTSPYFVWLRIISITVRSGCNLAKAP